MEPARTPSAMGCRRGGTPFRLGNRLRPGPTPPAAGTPRAPRARGAAAADNREPNNGPGVAAAGVASLPFAFDGTLSPRTPGDTDWYCFDASAGDRYFLSAGGTVNIGGQTYESPWVDPMLGFFTGDG